MKWKENEINEIIDKLKNGSKLYNILLEYGRTEKSIKEKIKKEGLKLSDLIVKNVNYEKIKCLECNNEFTSLISLKRKFCSKNCSASFNNKGVIRNIKSDNIKSNLNCLYCDIKLVKKHRKYCSNECFQKKRESDSIFQIENGNISLSSHSYKKFLIKKYGEKCMECGWCELHPITKKVPIELEHIDGNGFNNSLDNLKLLCPNCHSLTLTYKALNYGNGRKSRK